MKIVKRIYVVLILILCVTFFQRYIILGEMDKTLSIQDFTNGQIIITSTEQIKSIVLNESDDIKIKPGSLISIEASPDTGYSFGSWDGIDSENNKVYFEFIENKSISVDFVKTNFMVSVDKSLNGTINITPEIKHGRSYPADTIFTIKTEPDNGYVVDSVYYSVQGRWFVDYKEFMQPEATVNLNSDMRLGASFIRSEDLEGFSVIQNIQYAKPGKKPLKYDIYTPYGADKLPLLIIIHGGGWSSNNEDIMRGMARTVAKTGKYVVASIDYRWIGHLDGDIIKNSITDLISDVYGALAHIMENSYKYGADPNVMVITGDSAGGHLSASVATMVERIGNGVHGIIPTYLPENITLSGFKESLLTSIKAVAPSYGVFDRSMLGDYIADIPVERVADVCPIDNIPDKAVRSIPHFLVKGRQDLLIKDKDVQAYADSLTNKGQTVRYLQVEGAGHAFYDWKPDVKTQNTFTKYGIPYIDKMLNFFEEYVK